MALILGFVAFALLDSPLGAIALATGALIEVGEAYFWWRYLSGIRVRTGAEGLIGERALVVEACDPGGRVKVYGEIWHARCEAPGGAGVGETVSVVAVEGLTLAVEPGGTPR